MIYIKFYAYVHVRLYQINVTFHRLITFSGWPSRLGKNKVYFGMICITKITMIAKYLEDTSVHSQLANSAFLATHCHAVTNSSSSFYKYLAIIQWTIPASSAIFPSQYNNHVIYITFLLKIWKNGPGWICET